LLVACKQNIKEINNEFTYTPPNDYKLWNIKGKVKRLVEESYTVSYINNKWYENKLINKVIYNFNNLGFIEWSQFYDANGKLISENQYKYDKYYKTQWISKNNEKIDTVKYLNKYNKDGLLIETQTLNNNNKSKLTFGYDTAKNIIKTVTYDEKGEIIYCSLFKYDNKNRLVETKNFDKNNHLKNTHIQIYSGEVDYPAKYLWYDSYNNLIYEYIYEYDKFGNRVKVCIKNSKQEIDCTYYKYTYDLNNNIIQSIIQRKQDTIMNKRYIEYY